MLENEQFREMAAQIGNWLLGENTGLSSEFMASVALGAPPKHDNAYDCWPHDPSDFNRCYQLLKAVPGVRHYFNEIATHSRQWSVLIEHWDELETLHREEYKSGRSPLLYARMKQLIRPENDSE